MTQLGQRLRSRVFAWWSARRGAARAMADVRYLRQLARVALFIVPLVLLPVILLAGLASRSLRSEEVLVDAHLRQRAEAMAAQVQAGERALFTAFEEDVAARLQASDDAMTTLTSPGLVGAFRFDAEGRLAWPFELPRDDAPAPTAAWSRRWEQARLDELAGRLDEAIAGYAVLAARTDQPPALRGEARLAAARVLGRVAPGSAIDELTVIASEIGEARDREGRRLADLANLQRADLLDAEGRPTDAAAVRRAIVDRALAAAWFVGRPADGVLARLALEGLGGRMDERARRLAASRLTERLARLLATEPLVAELELVGTRGGPARVFSYQPEAEALWVVLTLEDRTWVFPFDVEALRAELGRRVVRVAEAADPDLVATLVGPSAPVPDALARVSLAPELPRVEVVVRAADPAGLVGLRGRNATLQTVVVALAVLATGLGLFLTWRFIDQELEAARQKADFAANVSHELRSPITQIRLKGEALQLDLCVDEHDRRAHYDAIVRESERLSRLVDNVLDFSAIERGVKRYHLRPEDLADAVYKAVDAMQAAAEENDFTISVSLPDDLPVVWLDREAIGQVLTNLLSNALKYGGDGGTIEVEGEVLPDRVELSVRDHGIGIAPEDLDQVFEHFFRVQSAAVRKKRGTGIGLTIVRYIVEAHGGTIRVESTLGQGSTFIVSLPLEPPEDAGA